LFASSLARRVREGQDAFEYASRSVHGAGIPHKLASSQIITAELARTDAEAIPHKLASSQIRNREAEVGVDWYTAATELHAHQRS
jgi:hypothetical protein